MRPPVPPKTEKLCRDCYEVKPVEEFPKNRSKPDGFQSYCKGCSKLRYDDYLARHPGKKEQYARASYARHGDKYKSSYDPQREFRTRCRSYGLTEEAYESLLKQQEGVCAICKQPSPKLRLCIDHCHTTGKVRGLLCIKCNLGIGGLRDDIGLLQEAILYLTKI